MAVFLSVLGAGVIGILQVAFCIAYVLWGLWNLRLERLDAIRREKEEKDARFDKATDAWKAAVAKEGIPRCTFCTDAGLGDLALGHTVTDANGIVTCPVLMERNKAIIEKKKAYSAQGAEKSTEIQTREEASLGNDASLDKVEEMVMYDPYEKDDH